jgi:hypothetical protein
MREESIPVAGFAGRCFWPNVFFSFGTDESIWVGMSVFVEDRLQITSFLSPRPVPRDARASGCWGSGSSWALGPPGRRVRFFQTMFRSVSSAKISVSCSPPVGFCCLNCAPASPALLRCFVLCFIISLCYCEFCCPLFAIADDGVKSRRVNMRGRHR